MIGIHPMLYTDGGGTRPVIVEPLGLFDRLWYGSSPIDYIDVYTADGLAWLYSLDDRATFSPAMSPIGSRFD